MPKRDPHGLRHVQAPTLARILGSAPVDDLPAVI